ncbi:MAG: amidase [Alphaproteobacteria bacterium]|nr:amidase [Alphaproteobacteria bacterium]
MSDLSLTRLPALEISRRVAAREIAPTAVVQAHLAAIALHNPKLNAVVTAMTDDALAQAQALEARLAQGAPVGLLAGVPVGIKDTHPTKGVRTTYGSPLMKDHVPDDDALIVERARAADAILIGKTNVPEFAYGANTVNAVFGATRNPWNTALSAAGSTGGGAAGLVAGMFALATGSDLGGSLRLPAAFCGTVGLRPSAGLVPMVPNAQPWNPLSVDGPMARRTADLALMLQAVAGPDPREPHLVPVAGRDFVAAATGAVRQGLRVAYCPDIARIGVDPEVERVCREAALRLRDLGCVVEEIDLDLSIGRKAFAQLRGQFVLNGGLDMLDKVDRLGANYAGNLRFALAQSPRDVALGERGRTEILMRMVALFERYDRLLTPCAPVPPFPVEQNYPETIAGRKMESYIDWAAPTFCLSLTGLPVASVPAGLDRSGLPVGLQVVGPRWNEEGVLALCAAIERVAPLPEPPLSV